MTTKYILEGKIPKAVDDVVVWGRWFETAKRHVNQTELPNNVRVSTVFLGIDHSFDGGVPILFGTMIFGGEHDEYQERYATWEEAEVGHQRAVKLARKEAK